MSSESDALRSFISERLKALDPATDTSAGSAADTEIIVPMLERLGPDPFATPIRDMMFRRLRSDFPGMVLQPGDPIDEGVIKPAQAIIAPYRRQVTAIQLGQSFASPRTLNEAETNALVGNFFVSRETGGFSVGVGRAYFGQPRAFVATPTNTFFTGGGLNFLPVENQAITAEAMLFHREGSLYFMDVVLRAENEGKEYNIAPGDLSGIVGAPEVVAVTNKRRFISGNRRETSDELISRAESSLGARVPINIRGIRAALGELFDSIQVLVGVGYNDPEMLRDLLTGSPDSVFAVGMLTASAAQSSVFLSVGSTYLTDGLGVRDFSTLDVEVGDTVTQVNLSLGSFRDMRVVEVVTPYQLRVSPPPVTASGLVPFLFKSSKRGKLTISGIPGGILRPQTLDGAIQVADNQVHIGGHMDVYMRAGQPQVQSIVLEGVRDAEPLHIGVDLESFGARPSEYVQVTGRITNRATTTAAFVGPGATTADILIQVIDAGTTEVPWRPTINDVGRYLQLSGPDYSMHQILSIKGLEVVGGRLCARVEVSILNQHTGSTTTTVSNRAGVFDLSFRIVELIAVTRRVRDRSAPPVDFNGSGDGIGGEVGDSVVIENGADAGIYTIRRILSSAAPDDTLILDRALTATVTPSGAGDGTGLRYRIDDTLEVDLVAPKILKIPLDPVFPGGDLSTVASSTTVTVTPGGVTNFVLAGIEEGDTLKLEEGNDKREFLVDQVFPDHLILTSAVQSTGSNLDFSVYRAFRGVDMPLVRVKGVELLDATNQPTGLQIPYGDTVDARVLGGFSNRAQGDVVDSFTGTVIAGSPLTVFEDTRIDFVARGVGVGWRLEIFEGKNAREYEIAEVNYGSNPNRIRVLGTDDGDVDFVVEDTTLHYRIGLPSAGKVRLYFLEPTSVEISTGIAGGRIDFDELEERTVGFRFSEVEGRMVLPANGTVQEDFPRDLRVAHVTDLGSGDFETTLEFTNISNPDVFESELLEGDVLEVYEQIPFRTSVGDTFEEAEIFGTPAGLRTIAGSNRVSIPQNSRIDFTQMGDLGGQSVFINSGPDAGLYSIQRVISAKVLELSGAMSASTEPVLGLELAMALDGQLVEDPPASGDVYLVDTTDSGQFGSAGDVITVFEASDPAVEGSFETTVVDLTNNRVLLDTGPVPTGTPTFAWVRTRAGSLGGFLSQPFAIYAAEPTRVKITEVSAKGPDVVALGLGTIPGGAPPLVTFNGPVGAFASVLRNDRLEIVKGPNAGVYFVLSATADSVTIYSAAPFPSAEVGVSFRVWAGLHGSTRMVRVRGFEGSTGRVDPGVSMPYVIRRPGRFRVSSTEMSEQTDGGLYYVDVDMESLGPGDDRNLQDKTRLVVRSGMSVDGYTYRVANNVLSFSVYEQVSLVFDRRFLAVGNTDLPENRTEVSGRNLQISYETSPTVRISNDVLRSDSRVIVADAIARHMLPSFVIVEINYEGGSSESVVGPAIEEFINSLGTRDRLEVSDIERFVQQRGASFIEHPIRLVAVTHDLDRKLVVERSDNFIGGPLVPYNGTGRTSTFFAVLGEGLRVTRR